MFAASSVLHQYNPLTFPDDLGPLIRTRQVMTQATKSATTRRQFKTPMLSKPSEMLMTRLWKYSSAGEIRFGGS